MELKISCINIAVISLLIYFYLCLQTEQINAEYKIRARKEHPDKNLADHSISSKSSI